MTTQKQDREAETFQDLAHSYASKYGKAAAALWAVGLHLRHSDDPRAKEEFAYVNKILIELGEKPVPESNFKRK